MDKQKLLGIILKDLEELKNLSEEIAEADNDAALIIDLALSKARLVAQEIDLLHEYTPVIKKRFETIQSDDLEDLEEDTTENYSDPDLEILHFESPEEKNVPLSETEEELPAPKPVEEPEPEEEKEEVVAEEEAIAEPEPTPKEEIEVIEDVAEENIQEVEPVDEEQLEPVAIETNFAEEKEIVVYDEDEDDEEDTEETGEEELVEEDIAEELGGNPDIEINKLEDNSHPEIREIHIDDLDDEEADSFKFAPAGKTQERSTFHEIPKPENTPKEKQIVGEKFIKEPSLNDSMAEKRPADSKLTNGPISSLRASVGLNDRFLFIREIFDNNAEKYNTIIDHLDKLETIQQAVEYLKSNLSLEKNETSMKFVDLLKRRFTR